MWIENVAESESSKKSQPLVTVGVPVFNEERHLDECLAAITQQTYPNLEIIVSDNASTDRTGEIISSYAAQDPRFRVLRHAETCDAVRNFAALLAEAHGDFFIWAGGHDRWELNLIECCLAEFQNNPKMVLAAPATVWFDHAGNIINGDVDWLDTRSASSPAMRALLFLQQMKRCHAFYGLYRTDAIRTVFPLAFRNRFGFDFPVLMQMAAFGDVVTTSTTKWYRREMRHETREEFNRRNIRTLGVTGMAAQFPLLVSRMQTISMFLGFQGTFREKSALLKLAFWRLVFQPAQLKTLWHEFILGSKRILNGR